MNGISSSLKDEIKKTGDKKNKEKFKFIAAVLVTNIMVAVLCLPMGEKKTEVKKNQKILHDNHQMMTLPLTVLVTTSEESSLETPVSLISKDKKIIVEKAWLHEAIKSDDENSQFKIEINNEDVTQISEYVSEPMLAVPYVQKKKIKVSLKRGSKYEVSI